MKFRRAGALSMMTLTLAAGPPPGAAAASVTGMLRADMTQPHERRPHGVPAFYDWASGPVVHRRRPPAGFSAFTAWGQLYQCDGSRFRRRAQAQIRRLQAWMLSGGRWRRMQRTSAVSGAAFAEDFHGRTVAARVRARSRHGTRVQLVRGHNFHFWPAGRAAVPRGVQAVAVLAQVKLIRAPRGACLTMSVGADWWRSRWAQVAGSSNTAGVGVGRFRQLRQRWRTVTMTSATGGQLRRYPLPRRALR